MESVNNPHTSPSRDVLHVRDDSSSLPLPSPGWDRGMRIVFSISGILNCVFLMALILTYSWGKDLQYELSRQQCTCDGPETCTCDPDKCNCLQCGLNRTKKLKEIKDSKAASILPNTPPTCCEQKGVTKKE